MANCTKGFHRTDFEEARKRYPFLLKKPPHAQQPPHTIEGMLRLRRMLRLPVTARSFVTTARMETSFCHYPRARVECGAGTIATIVKLAHLRAARSQGNFEA
jgi:hypothetical protein